MKTARGLSGFGDHIYLLAAIQQLFLKDEIQVHTNYIDMFTGYLMIGYDRYCNVNYDFSYLLRKEKMDTNQWQDMLINAGFDKDRIPFKLDKSNLEKKNGHYLLVLPLYPGFGNGKGVNAFMTPRQDEFESLMLSEFSNDNYDEIKVIDRHYPFIELCNMFYNARAVLCQQGWGTALSEALDVPCKVVFTERALNCDDRFINTIRPEKVFTKETSKAIILS